MAGYISEDLFHFVGRACPKDDDKNFDTLCRVLKSGWVSFPPHNPGWGVHSINIDLNRHLDSEDLIVPQVTCYCDIPMHELAIHMQKYGRFGVAFSRAFLIRNGARPVMYFPLSQSDTGSIHGRQLLGDIEAIYRGFRRLVVNQIKTGGTSTIGVEPTNRDEVVRRITKVVEKDFLAFVKPFNADLAEDDPENFYMEREWRVLGNIPCNSESIRSIVIPKLFIGKLGEQLPEYANKIYPV